VQHWPSFALQGPRIVPRVNPSYHAKLV
jgi:hypothetical protein